METVPLGGERTLTGERRDSERRIKVREISVVKYYS